MTKDLVAERAPHPKAAALTGASHEEILTSLNGVEKLKVRW